MYDTLVLSADPPWHFKTWSPKGDGRAPGYKTMSVAELVNLPVKQILPKNAVLFLWVTWPHLENSFKVMNAWGFKYKTNAFIWRKPRFKKGYFTRKQTEICLLGVKGSMPVASNAVSDHINALTGEHSAKPREFYKRVEQLYPQQEHPNRIELFVSKNSLPLALEFGYTPLGFDVDGIDIRESLKEMIRSPHRHPTS